MSKEFTTSHGVKITRDGGGDGITAIRRPMFPTTYLDNYEMDALREFFEWEANHKPWEDAEDGEIWALTINGEEKPYDRHGSMFFPSHGCAQVDMSTVTAGRRIWPENAS